MALAQVIERYVGVPYVPGQFDCADLVIKVLREVFGREISLPQDRVRPIAYHDMARTITDCASSVARRRPPGDIREGDGVLLARGSAYPTHIGVLVRLGEPGEWYVLHNACVRISSVLTLLRDLPLHGWRVEGIYEWI